MCQLLVGTYILFGTKKPACNVFFCPYSYSADYDYKATTHTLLFKRGSQQQCLEIEIINDSLSEDWEVFTILLSTKNSAVNLTVHRVDVYIEPNNGIKIIHCDTCML